jgi:hypothetical protein
MRFYFVPVLFTAALSAYGQWPAAQAQRTVSDPAPATNPEHKVPANPPTQPKLIETPPPPPAAHVFTIKAGTKIPLSMINSVSTKSAEVGDRVYLETVFPILDDGRIVIPPGSYVAGTITETKRPGRIHGRGELYVRFDSLTLPNGVTRYFRSRIGSLDGQANDELNRSEGKIKSEGNKGGDLKTIGEAAGAGASAGGLAGAVAGHPGMGAGIGAAGGAAAALVGVLLSRGPDAILAKGTTLEMVLDRPITFDAKDINFGGQPMPRVSTDDPTPLPGKKQSPDPMRHLPGIWE